MTNLQRKYIDPNEIISRGAYLNMILSPRGPGKSWAMKDRSLERFFMFQEKFIYVRRTIEEIDRTKHTHFDDILHQKYLGKYEMRIKGDTYSIRKAQPKDLDGKELADWQARNPWEECGYAIPVARQQAYKSSAFPDVTTIYYDEFLPENPWARVNPDEVNQFFSLIETVVRDRKNVKIFMLSNTGFINNPYFKLWNIKSSDFKQQEFIRRMGGAVCVWYYRYDEKDEEFASNKVSSLISGESFKRNSIKGEFKDGGDQLVMQQPKKTEFRFNMISEDGTAYRVFYHSEGWWVQQGKPIASDKNYSFGKWELSEDAFYSKKIIDVLKDIISRRKLSFDSPDTRATFMGKLRKG